MLASELRDKTSAELENEIAELRKEQFNLRMQQSIGQAPGSHQFKKIRKDIARIKTVITEQRAKSSD